MDSTQATPTSSKAADLVLDPHMPASQALRDIVGNALSHFRANRAAAAAGDVEGVHQLRVAIRRLRSALVLFGEMLEPHAARRFGSELRRLGRLFGQARDWDVFCTETLTHADAGGAGAAAALGQAAVPARTTAHEALRAELAGPEIERLLAGIAEWADLSRDGAGAVGETRWAHSLELVAPALLARLERKVRRRARHLRRHRPEELHAFRKALKKLRYGAQFLEGVYGRRRTRAFRRASRDLQKLLGRVNDAASAARLAATLDAGDRPDLAPATGALAKWSERRVQGARHDLPRAWKAFRAAKRPWHR